MSVACCGRKEHQIFPRNPLMDRRKKNTITQLKTEGGEWCSNSDTLKQIVCDFFRNLYICEQTQWTTPTDWTFPVLLDMNESLICLISKQPHPETIAQFRTICLSNVVVKIVSKVITNRLKPLMADLVGLEQASFIPGRHTMDNIIVRKKLYTLLGKAKEKGALITKIDLEKAYDRIDW